MLTFILLSCVRPPATIQGAAVSVVPDVSTELAAFFDRVHTEELATNPILAAHLGVPHDDTKWTSISYARAQAEHDAAQAHLDTLRDHFSDASLSEAERLSYRLFEVRQQRILADLAWFWHGYRVNQQRGIHTFVPAFLTTVHAIDSEATARSWIARIRGVPALFAELSAILSEQESRGILPPAFAYPRMQQAIANLLAGAPFDDGPPSPLLAHFDHEVSALQLAPAVSDALHREAVRALTVDLAPAYRALSAQLAAQSPTTEDGAWKLPDGAAYYAHRLQDYTTTALTADEIHALGLVEVARIQEEMVALMPALGVVGGLPELFDHLRTTDAYTLPNTDGGREAYLELARGYIEGMEARLPEVFDLLPKAPLEVRRVEPWREGNAGKGFYQPATPDGTRPGLFYANLRDMANMPTYQLQALVYHEGIPGHHLQNAVSMELEALPPFRRFGNYTAYGEGWGLYSEFLPKEMGLYTDPASDMGRLAMELWRAARLVVDTGIHQQHWTREQAIDYLLAETPNPRGDCVHAIERYIVTPGQATAYKIGMLKILQLRTRAADALGSDFRLADFHTAILGSGPLPLTVLEERVGAWLDSAG